MRRSSIADLPRLLNVIQGSMSVAGPRTHALGTPVEGRLLEVLPKDYAARHRVKPGITRWPRITGLPSERDWVKKVDAAGQARPQVYRKMSISKNEYIEKSPMWLGLNVIPQTLRARTQRSHRAFKAAARARFLVRLPLHDDRSRRHFMHPEKAINSDALETFWPRLA